MGKDGKNEQERYFFFKANLFLSKFKNCLFFRYSIYHPAFEMWTWSGDSPPCICTFRKVPETNTLFVSLVILNKVSHISKGCRLWEVWNDPRSCPYTFLHSTPSSRRPLCFQTLRRCQVELELEEMALAGNYKMQKYYFYSLKAIILEIIK